jgi:cytoskeletal protein CcmA (bactofilin family)
VAKSRKAGVVDSYSAIKAAQHSVKARPPSTPAGPLKTGEPADLRALGAAIAHTAVPAKQFIECYECGYKFQLHGRASSTNCSKCRAILDLTDHTIAKKWNGPLKTAGSIHIAADGTVETGDLVANDVILEGAIEAGIVRAMRKLELRPGARFSEHNLKAPDLLIAAGATIAFIEPAEFGNVDVFGTLRANLHAGGTVTVRACGFLQGAVRGKHLVVEEGGGLQTDVQIEPDIGSLRAFS